MTATTVSTYNQQSRPAQRCIGKFIESVMTCYKNQLVINVKAYIRNTAGRSLLHVNAHRDVVRIYET